MSIASAVENLIPEAAKYLFRDRTFQACLTAGTFLISPGILDRVLYILSGRDLLQGASSAIDFAGLVGLGLIIFGILYRLRMNSRAVTEKRSAIQRQLLANIPKNRGVLQHDAQEAFGAYAPADAIAALLKHTMERKSLLTLLGRGGVYLAWDGTWFRGKSPYLRLEKNFYWGAVLLNLMLFLGSLAAACQGVAQFILASVPWWVPGMWGVCAALALGASYLFLRDVAAIYAAEKIIRKGPAPKRSPPKRVR